jgi:hypothetical protein
MLLRTLVLALTLVLAAAAAACGDDDVAVDLHGNPITPVATEPVGSPTHDPSITPTVPESVDARVTFMFCEPVYVEHESGDRAVATVPHGMEVVYQPGSCEPEFEGDLVRVRTAQGTAELVEPSFGQYRPADSPEFIVWRPAMGVLDGEDVIMSARFIEMESVRVEFDFVNQPAVIFHMTQRGEDVLESLTTRVVGLPLAVFIDDKPLLDRDGRVFAPVVQSSIRDTGQITGLSLVDAERLVALFEDGMLE